jgi:hypothetical protein
MKFILTDELGRLSKWLRILGFDAKVEKDRRALAVESLREDRIILTRDSKMSRFTGTRIVKIESDFVEEQLVQLFKKLGLSIDKNVLFTRCVLCNENLERVERDSIKRDVPKYVFEAQELFMRCPRCKKVYWRGSHWALVDKFLNSVKGQER